MNQSNPLHPVILAVAPEARALVGREKVAALRQRAREALKLSAQYSGLPLTDVRKDAKGVPLPDHGVHWSLTHKSAYVAAVADRNPIGIDLETVRPCSQALYRRLADDREWGLAPKVDTFLFFRFWTAKEAVLKAVGQGLVGLSHCRIRRIVDDSRLDVTYRRARWTVVQHWLGQEHLAALTAGRNPVQWHLEFDL